MKYVKPWRRSALANMNFLCGFGKAVSVGEVGSY